MAQRTIVLIEDDLGDGVAAETLAFGVDGNAYEIDLNEKNAAALRATLAPYVAAARRVIHRPPGGSRGNRPASGGPDAATLRAWALENGYAVNARGRVSAEIRAAYENR